MFPVFCFALFPLPFDLAVHPPAAGLLRLASCLYVADQITGNECTDCAGGE